MIPFGPMVDKDGNCTEPWRAYFQKLEQATGGPAFSIQWVRVNDTTIKPRMKGADGVNRTGPNITLS